ncbi:hypothetical protein QC590_03845 [Pseudomonas putida]|uniref:hypothetical protein n=1 Tax=Pseudomonas putida TaxID=303 RepID=UPI00334E0548
MEIKAGSLRDYLRATLENAKDHLTDAPQLMFMIDQMDRIFHDEIFSCEYKANPTTGLLVLNAYTMLLGAVRQALSGHVVSTYPIIRAALESACYAFIIARDESKADIWLNRHASTQALQKCRTTFTAKRAANELKAVSAKMAEYVTGLYDASIDFGAHPNQKSVVDHLEDSGPVGNDLHSIELTGVYGHNSWQVNQALLACVEIGQAVAFLVAACVEDHPLINERVEVFESWMDVKNQTAEELTGSPVEYAGPMYSSVIPPK